ncbi:4Fe-4S dicluster domain-containing protein [Heliobacillus mobilis]|uniref:4Fe-4S dicluster domain-containing protein n=1 Tax=Heliobacterium mobile TaxID=28064 RepID=A0A6I3SLZ2_HELMO|nr:electron transfer flavoprotein subunit alpha/FixB family protein [Heliobacterium mobile]MTV49988.1 4Fe-4S dicluster domain-containing protein [Heliobacterium mobile]
MAIRLIDEKCTGCGACESQCPFGAIVIDDSKARFTESCTHCGACVSACPFEAIVREEESPKKTDENMDYRGLWVFIEQDQGQSRSVSFELLGEGRKLADAMGQELAAVVIGDRVEALIREAVASGADKVYVVEGSEYSHYDSDAYTKALTDLVNTYRPNVLLLGATINGRDLGPRVACRVETGLTADCTELGVDAETGLVAWTRPAFGGNIMATILCPNHRPQMGTVRPNVFKRPAIDYSRTGEIIRVPSKVRLADLRTTLMNVVNACTAACNLEEAEIIVSGGRGMGKPENFQVIEQLARVLGGAVGASRAVVDAGWMPHPHQVGQTGKTVSPKIYFACGISGAVQHLAGMSSSDIIVAVNKDPEAPIFKVADFGIVGDVLEILPAMIKEFEKCK